MNISRSMENSSVSITNQSITTKESLELSGKMLDKYFSLDDSYPTLIDKMHIVNNCKYINIYV